MWVSRNGSGTIRSNGNGCDDKTLLQSGAHQLSIGVRWPAAAEQPAGRWTPWAPRRSSGRLSLEEQKEMVGVFASSGLDEILVRRCDGGLKKKKNLTTDERVPDGGAALQTDWVLQITDEFA